MATRDGRVAAMRELYAKGDADGALALAATLSHSIPPPDSYDSPDSSIVVEFAEASIEIDDPFGGLPLGAVALHEGAVASSSRLRRRWSVDGQTRHHLIDPRSGVPVEGDVAAVTVVAALGWQAEVLAKAAFVGGAVQGLGLVAQVGGAALLIDAAGQMVPGPGWERYGRDLHADADDGTSFDATEANRPNHPTDPFGQVA